MFRRQEASNSRGANGRVSETQYDAAPIPEFDKRPAFIHILLLNKTIRLFVVLGLASVVIPVFAYLFFFSREIGHDSKRDIIGTCGHPALYHIPCGYPSNLSMAECHLLGCCYTSLATCYHSLPSEHQYIIGSDWSSGTPSVLSPYRTVTPYDRPALPEVRFDVSVAEDGVGGFRFLLSKMNGTGAPSSMNTMRLETAELLVQVYSPTFFIEVKRKADQKVIFSSARGPLIMTDEFIEWTLHLGADTLFGLGRAYLEPGTKFLLLNNLNSTAVPIVMGYNANLKIYNGLIFNTPGLTEVEIVGSRLIVVRAQLGANFDLRFLAGPTPAKLFLQSKAILKNQYTPPYWAYGVHVCDQSPKRNLTNVRRNLELLLNETIMFDSHCLHNDQFWISDTMTLGTELESLRQMLRDAGKKFVPSLVLTLAYGGNPTFIDARENNILLRHPGNQLAYQGRVRNRTVAYIDWRTTSRSANLSEWLDTQWQKVVNLGADGYTLEEASPRDERNSSLPWPKQLLYQPDHLNDSLVELLPWNTILSDSSQLVLSQHNDLGVRALEAIQKRIDPGNLLIAGSYGLNSPVAVLPANVSATWISLRSEVDRVIGLSMAGITFTGTPICGNAPLGNASASEELCIRWYQFGSLLPLFRVTADRTPDRFSRFGRRVMHAILRKRFSLLEYLHTLILEDAPYLRPMFYHYEEAANFTTELWEQFMIGDALLVAPVLLPQMSQIAIYFPESFYELWGGQAMPGNDVLQYAVVESDLPMFLRPGYTVPLRDIVEELVQLENGTAAPVTAELSRLKPLYLVGAFECNARRWRCSTSGRLLLQTGFLLEFGAILDERLIISVRANVSEVEGATLRQLACSEVATLNVTIGSVQLYGHPNSSQPLLHDIEYDFCQQEAKQVEFVNSHRKGPSDSIASTS
ncbi:probable maltase-glucoamylase 2 [Anopheles ziemanni]|uniref:probable maltase-glucoamylase 2 n=1 Tax=Anopheles coustani TaxID=139045 RepID=UPI00265B0851|nr:probable maltase-glucoamylase 2 [Anopheles coustani]XP_058169353.1 probable maltase-glucoamylase 2 [Anopheles ziemanni]